MSQKPKQGVSFGKREIVNPNKYVKYAIFYDGVRVGVIQGNQDFLGWGYRASVSMRIGGKSMFREWDTSYYVATSKAGVRDFFAGLHRA